MSGKKRCPDDIDYNVRELTDRNLYKCPHTHGVKIHLSNTRTGEIDYDDIPDVPIGGTFSYKNACNDPKQTGGVPHSYAVCPCNKEYEQTNEGNCWAYAETGCRSPVGWTPGSKVVCKRISYNANPEECCIQNINSNTGIKSTTAGGRLTCNPVYRDWTSSQCSDAFANYCSTHPEEWNNINTTCQKYCNVVQNKSFAGKVANKAIASNIFSLNSPRKEDIERANSIITACSKNAGACDQQLNVICSQYSREDIEKYVKDAYTSDECSNGKQCIAKNIVHACGCHLNLEEYAKYHKIIQDIDIDIKQVEACDPLCVMPGVIKKGDEKNKAITCDATNCVLDDINITIVNSKTGDIDFSSLCGNCGSSQCNCYFSNINVYNEGSDIGKINFSNNCNKCFTFDENDPSLLQEFDCGNNKSTKDWIGENLKKIITFFLMFLFLVISLLFAAGILNSTKL